MRTTARWAPRRPRSTPLGDRFTFHVTPAVACSDPANPPAAAFTVVITADGLDGAAIALQTFTINLDLDVGGGTTTYTQNFAANPGWTVGVTAPDNPGCTGDRYTNDFHWCAACGNGGGGYGAWVGNVPVRNRDPELHVRVQLLDALLARSSRPAGADDPAVPDRVSHGD